MILSATGHRPNKLGGYSDEALKVLIKIATEGITTIAPTKVISGMAIGWDTAVAIAAIQLKIPLIAAVPFIGQEKVWSTAYQNRYNKILSKASEVIIVSEGSYSAYKLQLRNEYMVDNSDIVLAMWNGSSGGTGNCIKYAIKHNKHIINMWDSYNKLINSYGGNNE